MLWDGDRLLGVARTFVREIEFLETRQRIKTLALAGVCSDPNHRGCGSGRRVVQSAFERIGKGGQFCLFQTGVPEFYKKLGARTVENEFVNSLSSEDPRARPWWNEYVMQFGDPLKWQKGRVDLLGAGY